MYTSGPRRAGGSQFYFRRVGRFDYRSKWRMSRAAATSRPEPFHVEEWSLGWWGDGWGAWREQNPDGSTPPQYATTAISQQDPDTAMEWADQQTAQATAGNRGLTLIGSWTDRPGALNPPPPPQYEKARGWARVWAAATRRARRIAWFLTG
jgi:hypothetical protein